MFRIYVFMEYRWIDFYRMYLYVMYFKDDWSGGDFGGGVDG